MVIGLGYTMCVRFGPKCQGFVIAIATSSLHTSEEFSCVRQARTRRCSKEGASHEVYIGVAHIGQAKAESVHK